MNAKTRIGSAALVLLATAGWVRADLTLSFGSANLLPDTANQTVSVFADNTGTSPVPLLGVQLEVQVADGQSGPPITQVDLTSSANLFGSNNNGMGGQGSFASMGFPSLFEAYTLTDPAKKLTAPYVNLPTGYSQVATVTLNTVGFKILGTQWKLSLGGLGALNGDSALIGVKGDSLAATLLSTQITLVPEPPKAMLAFGLASVAVALGVGRRHRR